MPETQTFVSMRREDGKIDSELHLGGLVVKPDPATGNVSVPSQFVVVLLNAGYVWSSLS